MLFNLKRVLCFLTINIIGLTFVANITVSANELQGATSLLHSFNNSNNSVERREIITSLKIYLPEIGEETPEWVEELLGTALNDKHPVVVAAAAYQIGQFNLAAFNDDLIQLYKDADSKFSASGYHEKVKSAIIPTLGIIGNAEAKVLISKLLKEDKGYTCMGDYILEAIKNSSDPAFVQDLKLYAHKMSAFVEEAVKEGTDPMHYSSQLRYMELAFEIKRDLLLKGGK